MISIQSPELLAILTRIAVASERQANALEAISFALQTYGAVQVERDPPEFVPFAQVPASEAPADHASPIPEPAVNPVPAGTPAPPVDIFAAARATAAANAAAPAPAHPWGGGPIPAPPAAGPNPDFSAPTPSASIDKKPWDR